MEKLMAFMATLNPAQLATFEALGQADWGDVRVCAMAIRCCLPKKRGRPTNASKKKEAASVATTT